MSSFCCATCFGSFYRTPGLSVLSSVSKLCFAECLGIRAGVFWVAGQIGCWVCVLCLLNEGSNSLLSAWLTSALTCNYQGFVISVNFLSDAVLANGQAATSL